MVDTVFVGRVIGGSGIGALVVVFPIQRLMAAISAMMAVGSSTAVARSSGEGDYENVRHVIKSTLSLIFIIVIPLTFITLIFRDNVLRIFGASEKILPLARDYLSIVVFGGLFQCLSMTMCHIMMALGNRRVTLISTSLGAIMNAIVDAILVVKLSYGVKGAAFATIISQFAALVFAYYHFLGIRRKFNLSYGFKFDKDIWKIILTVGFSAFIVEAEDGITLAVLNNLLLRNAGDNGVIILGIISKLSMSMFITMLGISAAMQPIAAYNLGAENYDRIKKILRKTGIFSIIATLAQWIIGMIFAEPLISIFVKDEYLIKESAKAFRILIAVFPIISIYYMAIYYYQALGKGKTSFLVSIFRQIIILIPLAFILIEAMDFGALGAWISYPISDLISSITAILMMKKEVKKLDKKIKMSREEEIEEEYSNVTI